MGAKKLTECLACGHDNLKSYLDLGAQVCANTYPAKPGEPLEKYPLEVFFCANCCHSQLGVAVDPAEMFKDYLYVSGTTQTLKEHFRNLVNSSVPMKLLSTVSVLDIGANDYSLLKAFKARGVAKVEGCDPSENLAHLAGDIEALVDFWDSKAAYKVKNAPYDLICGLNVFAHNLDPYDFLLGCRRALKPDGRVLIEFPYARSTVVTNDFGQIYHEHINYFTVSSMGALVERAGFRISELHEFPDIHGGTLRFILSLGVGAHCAKAREKIKIEYLTGMLELETYQEFGYRSLYNINEFKKAIAHLVRKNLPAKRKIIAYGASAKLSTLLGYMAYPGLWFEYIVDDNPLKVDRYQIDSGLKIRPTTTLEYEANPIIVVTAHNFYAEIKSRLISTGIQCTLVKYVPEISIEEI